MEVLGAEEQQGGRSKAQAAQPLLTRSNNGSQGRGSDDLDLTASGDAVEQGGPAHKKKQGFPCLFYEAELSLLLDPLQQIEVILR